MIRARLLEIGVFGSNALIIVVSFLVGLQISILLGVLIFVLGTAGVLAFIYRNTQLVPKFIEPAEAEDPFVLCSSGFLGRCRTMMRLLPSEPRCHFCLVPFGGLGRIIGIKASVESPNYCAMCFEAFPKKTYKVESGILFADIRGFTSFSEEHGSTESVVAVQRFYKIANQVLSQDDAFVNYVGDQVMAIYLTRMPSIGQQAPQVMVAAARRLIAAMREADGAPAVGVGINLGTAQVGNVEMGAGKRFSAYGDTVNTAARLQAAAGENEILLSKIVYDTVAKDESSAKPVTLELKGKSEPQTAYVISA